MVVNPDFLIFMLLDTDRYYFTTYKSTTLKLKIRICVNNKYIKKLALIQCLPMSIKLQVKNMLQRVNSNYELCKRK